MGKKLISIVTPCFNEEDNVQDIKFNPPNIGSTEFKTEFKTESKDVGITNILLHDGKILCENTDEIKDGDIVHFVNTHNNYRLMLKIC